MSATAASHVGLSTPSKSILTLHNEIRALIDDLALTSEVVRLIIPNGTPINGESQLWDYKEILPSLPIDPNDADKKLYKSKIGDIIKDAVAFHNSYGGYIIFGISDKGPDRIKGCSLELDCGDFNKRLQSYTGVNIECHYSIFNIKETSGSPSIGILLIPRRKSGATPVRFQKDGPEKPGGGRCFGKETYVRIRDECRPAANTSDDWAFLHSDRALPEAATRSAPRAVKASLPARDPDLLEFLGREGPLRELRNWLADPRSPVRLITGIGGLGKTTLAFRFAEEVAATGAGDIDWVIWLTAKQQTFSALRGKMVPTGKVDFSGLESLYMSLLSTLSHEMAADEDDYSIDDMSDRVVEALTTVPSLIIVDDIDSLSPPDQKELVAQLNSIALRTVSRELPPSRVLFTSRIDQGIPQTSVIKISGLEFDDFEKHISNLCGAFHIPPITGGIMKSLFESTSGSPLFAASIVRLVSLGESLRDVVETWRGQEGEDVRRFAFEREIKRLDLTQAKLLYAVLLLVETSVSDLASVLDLTPKIVRDRVSELQAYQLLAVNVKSSLDSTIVAPNDLISISEILRSHLDKNATIVEAACARAEEKSKSDSKAIGLGIRSVLNAWEQGRPEFAVVIANELADKFPENGDISSIKGAAFLRLQPPKLREADDALSKALKLGCKRPELISNYIKAKSELEDWPSLYEFSRVLSSNETSRDIPLSAFILSCWELIKAAKIRNDDRRISQLTLEAVERITSKINRTRIDPSLFQSLSSSRFDFAREYITAVERMSPRAGDKLVVFEGVFRLSEHGVVLTDLLKRGIDALSTWWSDVERRPVIDNVAIDILGKQLRRLERIRIQIAGFGKTRNVSLSNEIDKVARDLAHRGAMLSS